MNTRTWLQLVHPPATPGAYDRQWVFDVERVWPARAQACATAVVHIYENGVPPGTPRHMRLSWFRALLDVNPRTHRLRVTVRDLPDTDWHLVADPSIPDLDGDGVPESFSVEHRPADATEVCMYYHEQDASREPGCEACSLPGGESFVLVGSRAPVLAGPFPFAGRAPDVVLERQASAAAATIEEDQCADETTRCPELGSWSAIDRGALPSIRPTASGFAIEQRLVPLTCVGWQDTRPRSDVGACTPGTEILRTILVEAGQSHVSDAPSIGPIPVTASCGQSCTLTAAHWRLPDTDRSPHRIPVGLLQYERESTADGQTGLRLSGGTWAIEVRSGTEILGVWQIVILPSQTAPVALQL